MAKIDYRRLTPEQRQKYFNVLMQMLSGCGLNEKGQEFLKDLIMESEVTMFARRITIARLLLQGLSFQEIQRRLHVGQNTIISVDRWLSAQMYGYRSILGVHRRSRRPGPPAEPYSLHWLSEKYPSRALLIHLLLGEHVGA